MFYTYAHYKQDNQQLFYIGKGKGNRFKSSYSRSKYWQHVVQKHGFFAEILAEWQTEQEALDHEKLLISCFKKMNYDLVNLTDGGEGTSGWKPSQQWKEHRAKIAKEQYESGLNKLNSKESIKKGAEKRKGKPLSDSHKEKIALSLIGNKRTFGKSLSEEHKKKISMSLLGNKRMLGKKLSEETKQKIARSVSLSKAKQAKH